MSQPTCWCVIWIWPSQEHLPDGRRLEVVADGLPLFGGVQQAVDTTLICALRSDGQPTTRATVEDGAEVTRVRRPHTQSWLADTGTFGGAGCGRFSTETQFFLSKSARAKARCENSI